MDNKPVDLVVVERTQRRHLDTYPRSEWFVCGARCPRSLALIGTPAHMCICVRSRAAISLGTVAMCTAGDDPVDEVLSTGVLALRPMDRTLDDLDLIYEELLHIKALSHLSNSVKRELYGVMIFESHAASGTIRKWNVPDFLVRYRWSLVGIRYRVR